MAEKTKKKLPPWIIAPIVGGLVVLSVFGQKTMGKKEADEKVLNVVKVKTDNLVETYSITGTVSSNKTKIFYSPVNAPVASVNAKVGQIVKAGDTLITFDVTNLERDNQQAQLTAKQTRLTNKASIETANKAARASKNDYKELVKQRNAVASKMKKLKAAASAEDKQNAKNQEAYGNAMAYISAIDEVISYDNKKISELNQLIADGEPAYAGKSYKINNYTIYNTSGQKFDYINVDITTYSDLTVWANNLTIQINDLSKTRAEQQKIADENPVFSSGDEAYAELQSQYNDLDAQVKQAAKALKNGDGSPTATEKENMKISEDLANLSTLSTEELVQKGREGMKAEFDGVVVALDATEGGSASQGGEMYTLVDMNSLTVAIQVPANDYEKVFKGEKATVKIGQKEYQGTVTQVNQIATSATAGDPAGTDGSSASGTNGSFIGATVSIDNPDSDIIVGVSAKLKLTVAEEKQVLTLPSDVVNTNVNGDFVYVIENGVVKEKPVEVGGSSDSKIEILSGLKENDQVISDTSGDIEAGMKATASEDQE